MILILCGLIDEAGPAWKDAFPAGSAFVFTPADICKGGIAVYLNDASRSRMMCQGAAIPLKSISGVLALTTGFMPEEFIHFDRQSNHYAAAETNALISYLLQLLPCRKINPPSVTNFAGPPWERAHWHRLARSRGIPCLSHRTKNGAPRSAVSTTANFVRVHCLDGKVIETGASQLNEAALELECAAKLNYLCALFASDDSGEFRFASASTIPDVSNLKIRKAVVRYLCPDQP